MKLPIQITLACIGNAHACKGYFISLTQDDMKNVMGIVKAQMPSKEHSMLKRALSVILHGMGTHCDREDYFDQGPPKLDILVFKVLLLAISLLSLFKDHAY